MDEFLQSLIFLAFIGFVALPAWIVIGHRLWRGQPILEYEQHRTVPWNWVDVLIAMTIFLVAQGVCLVVAMRVAGFQDMAEALHDPRAQLPLLAGAAVANLLTFALSLMIILDRTGATARDFGLDSGPILRDILYGFVGFLAVAPIVYFIQMVFNFVMKIRYDHPLIEAFQDRQDLTSMAILSAMAVIAAPLTEEFFFRVLLQGWLEAMEVRAVGHARDESVNNFPELGESIRDLAGEPAPSVATPPVAGWAGLPMGSVPILISSLLFASVHLGQGAAPAPLLVYALMLGFLYHRTHRLMPSLVAHFALNSTSMVMLFLAAGHGAN
ncbi:MAG: CPBP family intramembrane metalloprotease [Pirellulales bacterium]|nr:CPBP family intramembrane metalloprotease [Pirellulales bacterium]